MRRHGRPNGAWNDALLRDGDSHVGERDAAGADSPATLSRKLPYFFKITYRAWIIPGTNPRSVRRTLIQKWIPNPTSRKTPTGGSRIASTILRGSVAVTGMIGKVSAAARRLSSLQTDFACPRGEFQPLPQRVAIDRDRHQIIVHGDFSLTRTHRRDQHVGAAGDDPTTRVPDGCSCVPVRRTDNAIMPGRAPPS